MREVGAPTEPTPITLRTLPGWAIRTARADRRSNAGSGRPFSLARVAASVRSGLRRPIFLVGAPRSGTTFLGEAIGRLSEVSYHFEPVATKAAARYVYEGAWGNRRARWFYRTVYGWLLRLHLDGDLRFSEKTPQNSFIVPFLADAFPDAQFIHILRDGRDVTLSYSRQPWLQEAAVGSGRREPGGYAHGPVARFWVERERRAEFETTTDVHRCAWAWRRFTESVLDAATGLGPDRYLEIRYEQLVRDPAPQGAVLAAFLGVHDEGSRARFDAALAGASSSSVGLWRAAFSQPDLAQIDAEAGPLLRRLGYEPEAPR